MGKFLFSAGCPIRQGLVNAVPHVLCGIEFGGVSRKVLGMETGVPMEELLHQLPAMNRPPIPQQDHRAGHVTEQGRKKAHHFFAPQGPAMELCLQRQVLTLGRDGHGGEGIDAPVFVPHGAVGSLPLRGPGAFQIGHEQKPTFVQENQMRPELRGLFLYAASGIGANGQSLPRRVDRRGARASDNSTPSRAGGATAHWDGSGPETLCE